MPGLPPARTRRDRARNRALDEHHLPKLMSHESCEDWPEGPRDGNEVATEASIDPGHARMLEHPIPDDRDLECLTTVDRPPELTDGSHDRGEVVEEAGLKIGRAH